MEPAPQVDPPADGVRRLTIGIDIRRSGDFGVGIYTRNLVRALLEVAPHHDYVLFGRREHLANFGEQAATCRFEPYDRRYNARISHLEMGFALRRLGLDVFHVPHRWVPATTPGRYLVTVHDLNNILYPNEDASKTMQNLRERMLRRGLRRASRVIAVSEATKRDVVQRLGIDASRISVVYSAVDNQAAAPVGEEERKRTLERYSINEPFVLYAGRIQVHKNVPRLIEAFGVAKAQLENHWKYHNLKLIVIGDDLGAVPSVRHAVLRTRVQGSVRFLGFVPVETLRVFYDCAEVFLFPSLYEGFGMPPLEAMAHGTPVVTSNVSSLPEAVGDAAELVGPENVFDIARGLRRVLLDEDHRNELRRKGFEQLKKFSWERTARETLRLYEKAADSR